MRNQLDDAVFGREYLRGSVKVTERYDTNPGVIPAANTFGAPLGSSASASNQYLATFSCDLLRDYNLDVTTGYNLLHTSNYESRGFDLFDNAVYLSAARRHLWRGRPLQSAIRLDYDYLTVGSDSFLQRFQATPSWTITQSDFDATTLQMRYIHYDFLGQGSLNNTAFDQDADNLMVGLARQHRPCGSDAVLFGGYQYDAVRLCNVVIYYARLKVAHLYKHEARASGFRRKVHTHLLARRAWCEPQVLLAQSQTVRFYRKG